MPFVRRALAHAFLPGTSTLKAVQRGSLPIAVGLALGASLGQAHAQQAPNIGDVLRQSRPTEPPPASAPALPGIGGAPAAPSVQTSPDGGPGVLVKQFAISGNSAIDTQVLLTLLQDEQGKTLTLAGLDALAARLTQYYRSHGYFVARAYIPAQEVSGGTLAIRVVEGHYGKFILDNRSRVSDAVVQGLLDNVKDRDIVSLDTLERAMLIVNETPGVKVVRADVMPGEQIGSSDFAIATAATPAYDGYVLLDNYGSTYIGRQRLSFNAGWNSPTGRGDRLSVSGLTTRDSKLLNGRLGYSTLLGTDGTRGELAFSRTTYELGGIYSVLDASGSANGAELNFSKPLKRTRSDSIEAGLSINYKDLKDDIALTNTSVGKQLASISASLSERREHALFGVDGVSQGSVTLTAGHLRFKDRVAAELDAAGAHTQGSYAKLNVNALRISSLPSAWLLSTSLKAQAALGNKALDGVERMSVSGAGAVGAYPIGELNGDHAALLRAELSHVLPCQSVTQLSASVFADYGWAKQLSQTAGTPSTRTLTDLGVGLSAWAGSALLKLQLVHRLNGGEPTSESTARTRLLFQAGWVM